MIALCTALFASATASADILPIGHKSVSHKLVFEDSTLLDEHRLVAAPIAGLHGVETIEPGVPFDFSTKYGTRLYLVPQDVTEVTTFDRDRFGEWVSCPPPRSEIRSVPLTSVMSGALTTLRLIHADPSTITVEEVSHVEFDGAGTPVNRVWRDRIRFFLVFGAALLIVVAVLALRARATRRSAAPTAEPPDRT